MVQVSLPVSSFSKKIILADYAASPVALKKGDDLLHYLCYRRPRGNGNLAVRALLVERIEVLVGSDVAAVVQGDATGWHIHHMHLHRMLLHVQTAVLCGMDATAAIQQFYALHRIGEDDFAFESAYKRWQRFQSGKHAASEAAKIGRNARRSVANVARLRRLEIPVEECRLQELRFRFLDENPSYSLTTGGHIRKSAEKQFDCFLLKEFAALPAGQIARRLRVSRRNVHYSAVQFQNTLSGDKVLAHRFAALLRAHFPEIAVLHGL